MILKYKTSLPIVSDNGDSLRWFKRDAKRIKKLIAWDSGAFQKTEDGNYLIAIENKDKSEDLWVVNMTKDITTGRTRVTPVGEVDKLIPITNNLCQYSLVGSDSTYKKL